MMKKIKKRKNNCLYLVRIGKDKYYFTTSAKAGNFLGVDQWTVCWATLNIKPLLSPKYPNATVQTINGRDITYEHIDSAY